MSCHLSALVEDLPGKGHTVGPEAFAGLEHDGLHLVVMRLAAGGQAGKDGWGHRILELLARPTRGIERLAAVPGITGAAAPEDQEPPCAEELRPWL